MPQGRAIEHEGRGTAEHSAWPATASGVAALPGGALVRGRRLRLDLGPADFALVLGRGAAPAWEHRRVAWPDFGLPLDLQDALGALSETYARTQQGQRVEVACAGGIGRTGTALTALAVLDGLDRREAVAWVRRHHHPRAVETPWQRRWLRLVDVAR